MLRRLHKDQLFAVVFTPAHFCAALAKTMAPLNVALEEFGR